MYDSLVRNVAQEGDTLTHKTSVPDSLLRKSLVRDTLSYRIVSQDTLRQDSLYQTEHQDTLNGRMLLVTDEWDVPSVDSCLRASAYNGPLRWKETTSVRTLGERGELFTASYYRTDFYVLLLLAGLALLLGVWKRSFRFLRTLALQFFFPLRQTPTSSQAEVAPPKPHVFLAALYVLSVAMLSFRWFDDRFYYLYTNATQPYLLFLSMCLGVFLYLVIHQLLVSIVHAVFFPPAQRQTWKDCAKLTFCVQATLVFLVVFVGFLMERTSEELFLIVLGVVVCSKLLLLYKAKNTFFCGLYGYLHILLYLCALETAPLLILGKILMNLLEQSDMVIY